MDTPQQILDRLLSFGVRGTRVSRGANQSEHAAAELERTATYPAVNYAEAMQAETRTAHYLRLKTAFHQLQQASLWLKMAAELNAHSDAPALYAESRELLAMFARNVRVARANSRREKRRAS
ncbi:MAG TPA: hypothetical protein VE967_04100 [Gemmatimonadaceae bacterium]|nr:hypothetical protein [Gemmatimonadaceae bacterium]